MPSICRLENIVSVLHDIVEDMAAVTWMAFEARDCNSGRTNVDENQCRCFQTMGRKTKERQERTMEAWKGFSLYGPILSYCGKGNGK